MYAVITAKLLSFMFLAAYFSKLVFDVPEFLIV
jgi:hypothetical protein